MKTLFTSVFCSSFMSSKHKIAYLKNVLFVFYVWIKRNSRFQDLLVSYSYDKIYASRNATCHWRIGRIVSVSLAGFELKQVPGQYSQLTQSSAWDLILPECLHDLPQRPSLFWELSQELHIEMGKNFIAVCTAVGRAVNSHRSAKMLMLVSICFGEHHTAEWKPCRMHGVKLGWEDSSQYCCGCGRWCSIYASADTCVHIWLCICSVVWGNNKQYCNCSSSSRVKGAHLLND